MLGSRFISVIDTARNRTVIGDANPKVINAAAQVRCDARAVWQKILAARVSTHASNVVIRATRPATLLRDVRASQGRPESS